jgi:general secretion pathway protein L
MRIIGVDIGSTSIKAVEIDSAFGRYEVQEYHEQALVPGEDSGHAVARLLATLPKAPDRLAMSLKTRNVTFRNLQLPTRDKKAIQSGVGFELEDELPFSIENAAFDYSIISQSKAGTQAHVATTLSKSLATTLDGWTAAGVDPDLVTTEAWAYRTLMNRVLSPEQQNQPVLLIQIGNERTTFYVHWRGVPILARDIAWGGADLTLAICQKYQIPVDQAETAKLDHGFVIPPAQKKEVTAEQVEFSDALTQPLEKLLAELRQIELTARSLTDLTLQQIYTSGGSSMLPGLNQVIEQVNKIPVKPLPALSSIATSGVTYSENTDAKFLLAASLCLCLVGSDRSLAINFRKGQYAKIGLTRELNMESLRRPLMAVGAIALCFFVSVIAQTSFYSSRITETNSALEKSVKSFFGSLSNSAVRTYMSNTSTLKSSVAKELKKQRELNELSTPNPKEPLGFVRELSSAIPKDLVVDLTKLSLGAAPTESYLSNADSSASLTFLVGKPEMVDRLSSIMTGKLSGLQKTKVEEVPGPGGEGKRWKITYTGKPTEESFGKWN